MTSEIGNYPSRWESHVVVSDGGTVYLRPIKPSDGPGIEALHARLSPESIYFRFFTPLPKISEAMLHRFVNVDYVDRYAVIALLGDLIIAVARYDRIPGSPEAEVAFLVDDAHQGRGLATIMLEHLAAVAKEWGISRFVADTLPENSKMLRVFHEAGFQERSIFQDGVVRVSFSISTTEESSRAMYEREKVAVSRSVRRLLAPKSVAVVGASRVVGSVGHLLFRNILESNFQGVAYPVNPNAESVCSVPAYASLASVPGDVDLAVIAVAAEHIESIIREAADKHVGALVIVSAGFSEVSLEGALLESQIVRTARRNGMRVVGAASMGVATMSPSVSLNATLSPIAPLPGRAALHAQSGALSLAILEEARRRGLGISSFVSSGNKADISGNDLLHYFEDDPQTSVIMLYIEDFGNPRTFSRIARRVSETKPIIAVKAKHSERPRDHSTGSSVVDTSVVDTLFDRTGVLRVDTLEQLFELANALVHQPLPNGPKVAILSNTGGPAPLCADACLAVGLEIPPLSDDLLRALGEVVTINGGGNNPIELAISSQPHHFAKALSILLGSKEVDAVIVLYIPTVVGTAESPSTIAQPLAGGRIRGTPEIASDFAAQVASSIAEASIQHGETHPKPVLANFLSLPGVLPALATSDRTVPTFSFPESAALALGKMYDYARWRSRPKGSPLRQRDDQRLRGRALIDEALSQHVIINTPGDPSTQSILLDPKRAEDLCEIYGLHVVSSDIISEQVSSGRVARLRVKVIHHPIYGPYLELGLSGDIAELIGSRKPRALPQSDVEVRELIDTMIGAKILLGYRSIPPLDLGAVSEALIGVTLMIEEAFEISSLVIDPLVITTTGHLLAAPEIYLTNWSPAPAFITRALRAV